MSIASEQIQKALDDLIEARDEARQLAAERIIEIHTEVLTENERLLKCESDLRKIHEGYMKAVREANMCFQYIDGTLMLLNRL